MYKTISKNSKFIKDCSKPKLAFAALPLKLNQPSDKIKPINTDR